MGRCSSTPLLPGKMRIKIKVAFSGSGGASMGFICSLGLGGSAGGSGCRWVVGEMSVMTFPFAGGGVGVMKGIAKPINQLFFPNESAYSHHEVVWASAEIKSALGIESSSVKKIIELSNKKTVKNGVKIKLPTNVIRERGRPQATNIGNEARVTIVCTFMKLVRYLKILFFIFADYKI